MLVVVQLIEIKCVQIFLGWRTC